MALGLPPGTRSTPRPHRAPRRDIAVTLREPAPLRCQAIGHQRVFDYDVATAINSVDAAAAGTSLLLRPRRSGRR